MDGVEHIEAAEAPGGKACGAHQVLHGGGGADEVLDLGSMSASRVLELPLMMMSWTRMATGAEESLRKTASIFSFSAASAAGPSSSSSPSSSSTSSYSSSSPSALASPRSGRRYALPDSPVGALGVGFGTCSAVESAAAAIAMVGVEGFEESAVVGIPRQLEEGHLHLCMGLSPWTTSSPSLVRNSETSARKAVFFSC